VPYGRIVTLPNEVEQSSRAFVSTLVERSADRGDDLRIAVSR
jgi:hypothetical protein